MSIEPSRSLLALEATRPSRFFIAGETRETMRTLHHLSNHLLEDIGYVRTTTRVVQRASF